MTTPPRSVMIAEGIEILPSILARFYNFHGLEKTDQWLVTIASRLDDWLQNWRIELDAVALPDTVNVVLFGHSRRAGDIVLKLSPPTFESRAELAALNLISGPQVVRLVDADPTISLMMLERLRPGTELKSSDLADDESTRIGAERLLAFWREPEFLDDLIPLDRWARELLDYVPGKRPGVLEDLVVHAPRSRASCSARRRTSHSRMAICITKTSCRAMTTAGSRSIRKV